MYALISFHQSRKKARQRGFTLLELMIVIIILGILASVAVPQFTRSVRKSRTAEAKAVIALIRGAEMRYFNEWGTIVTGSDLTALDIEDPNSILNAKFSYSTGGTDLDDLTITATGTDANLTAGITVAYTASNGQIVDTIP